MKHLREKQSENNNLFYIKEYYKRWKVFKPKCPREMESYIFKNNKFQRVDTP